MSVSKSVWAQETVLALVWVQPAAWLQAARTT
jgi:hypothetical protein